METGPLRCEGCGATWYSAAARQLVQEQERCPRCEGGPLVLLDAEGEASEVGPAEGEEDGVASGP